MFPGNYVFFFVTFWDIFFSNSFTFLWWFTGFNWTVELQLNQLYSSTTSMFYLNFQFYCLNVSLLGPLFFYLMIVLAVFCIFEFVTIQYVSNLVKFLKQMIHLSSSFWLEGFFFFIGTILMWDALQLKW
jgi:hypothetical protein